VPDESTVVTLPQGRIRGVVEDGALHWRGIPYAAPPVGELRWCAPRAAASWADVRSGAEYGNAASQPLDEFAGISAGPMPDCAEDCLYLNVCAPLEAAPESGNPVLVYFPGGGFRTGHGAQAGDGESFARAGIVVVTLNYRLGALGFANLAGVVGPAAADAGICGFLDQIAALNWVRSNIGAFGGDPRRITVYGVSAGGKSVGNLMASPLTTGLFSRAIVSSGGADHMATPETGTAIADRLCAELDCRELAALRRIPSAEIIAAQERILGGVVATWLWRPTQHPAALPALPRDLIAGGSAAGVRLLVGNNANEAATFALLGGVATVTAPTVDVLTDILGAERADRLLATYRAERGVDESRAKIAAMGDERYAIPTLRLADAQVPHGRTYRYRVDVAAPGMPAAVDGGHGTEVPMVWDRPVTVPGVVVKANPARERTAALIRQNWISFIRDGVPTADGLSPWPDYETTTRPVLIFDDDPHVELDPRKAERLVWGDATWTSTTWYPIPPMAAKPAQPRLDREPAVADVYESVEIGQVDHDGQ
jgi:para-nitrobenzyl esterase